MLKLPPDTREFVELLNRLEVKYVMLGGYAVAWHGHPRLTKDVDFFIEASMQNGERVAAALNEFGMGSLGLTAEDVSLGIGVHFGRPPWRIDLVAEADGITFAEAWASRVEADWDGLKVNMLSRELLLQNKRASGRLEDLADVAKLEKRG